MTIPNRTVSITGIFAADASTIIPADPVPGNSYRDTTMTGTVIREGWAFKTIVDSSKFNQAMYEYTSVTAQVEKYGFLPWSNQTDYVAGSVCLASNGNLYQAKQASGPSSTAVDPTVNTGGVWTPIMLGNTNSLFDYKWEDYLLNRQDWLRADSFSWQPGGTYSEAYNHLVGDISGITPTTETVGSYTITYYQATDGHKIVLADQESTVQSIYAESGVAWYYILDTTNTRFKLPRENPAREELIQIIRAKGNDTAIGFTDGTNNFGLRARGVSGSNGFLYVNKLVYGGTLGNSDSNVQNANAPNSELFLGITTDSTKSGIISSMTDSTSVYKGKKYLYFYVGQFSQSATEQTAGLNSELFNGKLDIDFGNLNQLGKQNIFSISLPDFDGEVAIANTTGGFVYETPCFGYIKINRSPGDGTAISTLYKGSDNTGLPLVNSNGTGTQNTAINTNQHNNGFRFLLIPVDARENYYFETSNVSRIAISFIPAKGATNA